MTSRSSLWLVATWLIAAAVPYAAPALAGVVTPSEGVAVGPSGTDPFAADRLPSVPPPVFCPNTQIDQRGRLVEHCTEQSKADFATSVYESPFDGGGADWLVSRELFAAFHGEELLAAVGSGVESISLAFEALLLEWELAEAEMFGEASQLQATVRGKGGIYAVAAVIGFIAVFGGAVAWLLTRRYRRRTRRLNAARRTATALMGELVGIRDSLRDLALDSRPGRLDALEQVAATREAFIKHQGYLRLIDRGMSTQIIGFYGELRALPEPYVEERTGKLGAHRVLRLDAADEFSTQSEALASRANNLADLLRHWLDLNLPREAQGRERQVRR